MTHPEAPLKNLTADTSIPHTRRRYPSDFTEAQWQWLSRQLPTADLNRPLQRELLSAIHYRWTTGCSWRMLPHDFPPWQTVYGAYRRWQQRGHLGPLRQAIWSVPRRGESASGRGARSQTERTKTPTLNPRTNPHSPPQALHR